MGDNDTSTATALATIGTVCWCIQLIPQVVRNWYVRDCEGVPPLMFFLFGASGVPFAIYFVNQTANTAIMIQPHLFAFFSFIGFWQSLYYPPVSWSGKKSTLVLATVVALSAGIEVACIIPMRRLYNKGTTWPNLIPGIIAAVLLAAGLLPPYWELFKRQGRVVGINFVFLLLDSSGAVFSMASVFTQSGKIDILGVVLYAVVFCLEYGIMLSHGIWALRVRFQGLYLDAESAEALDWERSKKERLHAPKTEPLRRFVHASIAQPVARKLFALKARWHKPEDNISVRDSVLLSHEAEAEPDISPKS